MWVINYLYGLVFEVDSFVFVEIDKGYKFLKESLEVYFLNFIIVYSKEEIRWRGSLEVLLL